MGNSSERDAKRAGRRDRQRSALDLRIGGLSYRAIAERTGVSLKQAFDDVQEAIRTKLPQEQCDAARALELAKLDSDEVLTEDFLDAIRSKLGVGDDAEDAEIERRAQELPEGLAQELAHVMRSRRAIQERRAAYLGLDAPKRSEVTGKGGGPIAVVDYKDLADMTDEQLAEARAAAERSAHHDGPAAANAADRPGVGEAPQAEGDREPK